MGKIDLVAIALHYSLLYFTIFSLSVLFLAFGEMGRKKKKSLILIVSSIMFVVMAFRGIDVGNDTRNYVDIFDSVAQAPDPFYYCERSNIEDGFIILSWVLSRIVLDARILFFVTSLFVTVSVGCFAYKYVDNLGVFYCLFFGMLYFDFLLSSLRQSIAIAILLFAFDYLIKRKPFAYFLLCALAVTFHLTAILWFVIYPLFAFNLLGKKHSALFNIFLLAGAFFCGFFMDKVLFLLLDFFPKYSQYVGSELFDGEPRVAAYLKLLVFSLLHIAPSILKKRPPGNQDWEMAGKQMSRLNLIMIIIASNAVALMRFSPMFFLYANMQYSNDVIRIRSHGMGKMWLFLLTVLAFYVYGLVLVLFKTPDWQSTYPIQLSLWIAS